MRPFLIHGTIRHNAADAEGAAERGALKAMFLNVKKRKNVILRLNARMSRDLIAGYMLAILFCKHAHCAVLKNYSLSKVLVRVMPRMEIMEIMEIIEAPICF